MNENPVFEVLAPSPGESISEVQISKWLIKNGDFVKKDQVFLELESEKVSLQIVAEKSGYLETLVDEGDTVEVNQKIAIIKLADAPTSDKPAEPAPAAKSQEPAASSAATSSDIASPAAQKIAAEAKIDLQSISGSGHKGRITKGDVLSSSATPTSPGQTTASPSLTGDKREASRQPMSMLRKKISQRLVAVKNQTAMLTTFNEVDMSAIMDTRKKYKDLFKEKHNIGLGFMSFFAKACTTALMEFPLINAMIEGDNIVSYKYVDLGIAVSAPKGLMVPIIRDAQSLSMAAIECEIINLANKARQGSLTIDEMAGGTFTITNGGVFGSMLSTPILNPPQSAILGMHNIVQRPVAIDGQVVIRPIMYLALSYDHRIVDGKDSVTFLYKIKSLLEDPIRLLLAV